MGAMKQLVIEEEEKIGSELQDQVFFYDDFSEFCKKVYATYETNWYLKDKVICREYIDEVAYHIWNVKEV